MIGKYIMYVQPVLYEREKKDYEEYDQMERERCEKELIEYEGGMWELYGLKERWVSVGTCFPVKYKDDIHLITARHCIDEHPTLKNDLTKFAYYLPDDLNNSVGAVFTNYPKDRDDKYNDLFSFILEKKNTIGNIAAPDLTAPPSATFEYFVKEGRDDEYKLNKLLKNIYLVAMPDTEYNYKNDLVKISPLIIKGCSKVVRNEEVETYSLIFDDMKIDDVTEREEGKKYGGISGSPIFFWDEKNKIVHLLGVVIEYQYLRNRLLEEGNVVTAIGVKAIYELLKKAESTEAREAPEVVRNDS